jgi:hypothetical protein
VPSWEAVEETTLLFREGNNAADGDDIPPVASAGRDCLPVANDSKNKRRIWREVYHKNDEQISKEVEAKKRARAPDIFLVQNRKSRARHKIVPSSGIEAKGGAGPAPLY